MTNLPMGGSPQGRSTGMPKWAIVLIVVVLGLGLLGAVAATLLGGIAAYGVKKAMEKNGVQIDQRSGTYTVNTNDGKMNYQRNPDGSVNATFQDTNGATSTYSQGAGAMADFPSDFPVFTGATVTSSMKTQESGKNMHIVTWSTGAPVADVKAYYVPALEAKGWKITTNSDINDTSYIAFSRPTGDDGGTVQITRVDEGTTSINVTLAVKP